MFFYISQKNPSILLATFFYSTFTFETILLENLKGANIIKTQIFIIWSLTSIFLFLTYDNLDLRS